MSTENPAQSAPAQEIPFQAEVEQVLSLVIHSLYQNKEAFLRELISNASDALDKARFLALTRKDITAQEGEARITLKLDDDARTLTIEDNGIGMTRDEIVKNLGTVAKSGTIEFLKAHAEAAKTQEDKLKLIGQFGVGFYASFMVASRVDVKTRSMLPGAEPVLWRSTGQGSFTVTPGDREKPGTEIVLHLKDDCREFAKSWRIQELIKKYSDFVQFPIYLGDELANKSKALWALPKSQVTEEQHAEFYRHITGGHEGEKPLLHIHYSVDAPIQFHALIYVPEKAPFDLFTRDRYGLRLYAKRVLIMDHCEKLIPSYLRFTRGVIDSEDLSLNVSREMLQEDRTLAQIETQVTKQILKSLKDLGEQDADKYKAFWLEFGRVLKEGVANDWKNREALAELLRFESLKNPAGTLVSFADYIKNAPESQKEIFFLTGPSRSVLEKSPHLEVFKKKDMDVLLMTDPIDEWVVRELREFQKKTLKSVAHGDAFEGDELPKDGLPEKARDAVKAALGDRVKDVRFSRRLTDSASCLVADEGDPGANFERVMKMFDRLTTESKRVLELNPKHSIVQNIDALATKGGADEKLKTWAELLYDQALLSEGVVEDPNRLVRALEQMLTEVSGNAARA